MHVSGEKTHTTVPSDIIFDFSQSGFALIPLEGKRAMKTGWEKTAVRPELTTIKFEKEHGARNYGVIAGPGTLIIDIDVRKGDGLSSFRALTQCLELKHGWENQTFVVKTGSGGFHIYLAKPPGVKIRKNVSEFPFIDFLSGNMYAVGPGSKHPETQKLYSVVFGSPKTLAPAPTALFEILKPSEINAPEVVDGFVDDDPLNIERYIELLADLPVTAPGGQRNACYIAACRGRDFGLSQKTCADTLHAHYNGIKLVPPIKQEEISEISANAYKYGKNKPGVANAGAIFHTIDTPLPGEQKLVFDMTKDGSIAKTMANAVKYLLHLPALKGCFKLNSFSEAIEIDSSLPWYVQRQSKSASISDEDVILLKYYLAQEIHIEFSTNLLWEAVIVAAHRKHYHPVKNYLSALIWDGVPRIDTWLSYYCNAVDNVFTRDVGRKVLCAAVRRIMHPGCKWDYVLVLEGAQGIGKSTVCRVLGKLWAGDVLIDPHNKDTVSAMAGKWIVELSEMAALKWAESNSLKAFISREKDVVRLPYKRSSSDIPRQSIFIGTVNPDTSGYLSDFTGNRRYWIVECYTPFKFIEMENDCDQLWAEAVVKYKKEKLFLDGEASEIQAQGALQRTPDNFACSLVSQWIGEHPTETRIILQDLLLYCGMNPTKTFKGDIGKVTEAMASAGWYRTKIRENGVFITVFNKPLTYEKE